jgi:hypothetical protein
MTSLFRDMGLDMRQGFNAVRRDFLLVSLLI